MTFDLPPQVERAYREIAAAKGVAVDALVRDLVIANCSPAKQSDEQTGAFRMRTPEEIRAWLDELASFSDKIPHMPGETFSREMIYQDHS